MRTTIALAAATALALSLISPAQAATWHYDLEVIELYSGDSRQVTLDCDPVGGTHPRAALACDLLEEAGGSVASISQVSDAPCPMIYKPVTAIAVQGAERYEETFGNTCVLKHSKGALFDF